MKFHFVFDFQKYLFLEFDGYDCNFNQCGALEININNKEHEYAKQKFNDLKFSTKAVEFIDSKDDLVKLEPGIDTNQVISALYISSKLILNLTNEK